MIQPNRSRRPPAHPGQLLIREFLEPLRLSQAELAKSMGLPVQRVSKIANGRGTIDAETALLLAMRLNTSAEFWMNLQNTWDLYQAFKSSKLVAAAFKLDARAKRAMTA